MGGLFFTTVIGICMCLSAKQIIYPESKKHRVMGMIEFGFWILVVILTYFK